MKLKIVTVLSFLFCSLLLSAQQVTVSGTVIEEATGTPAIGVTVLVKGTSEGTVTDIDGNYSLSNVPSDATLVFSYIGMTTREEPVNGRTTIDVTLQEDVQALEEVVVIGYGTARRIDLTGSIASVGEDVISRQPALNPLQSAQGKISGVNIVNNDAPGSTPTVVIRGLGTALGGRDPLYIVDGFPVTDIRNISASDIVSMDVLKDAASASIYGVRAANGVILITTKKGQSGKPKVGVESYVGVKNILNRVQMANAEQYIEHYNQNQSMLANPIQLQNASSQPYNTDWYDELIRPGIVNNNLVSVTGGSETVRYYVSYNYYDEDGLLDNQNYRRSTIRNNNEYSFFDNRLKLNQTLNISFSNEVKKPFGAFNEAYRQSPLVPVHYANGKWGRPFVNTTTGIVNYEGAPGDVIGSLNSIGNPVYNVAQNNERESVITLQGGFEGEFQITDFLKVNSRFGGTKYYNKNRQFSDIKNGWLSADPVRTEAEFLALKEANPTATSYAVNSLQLKDIETFRWTWEGFATFNKSFNRHNVEAVLGLSREKYRIGYESTLKGYEVPRQPQYWNLSMVSGDYETEVAQFGYTPTAIASYFGRLQYNFDHKYYISAVLRRDGASTFKQNQDYWGTFPSIGLGWTLSQEEFMRDVTFLDHLKLKGTWGKLGNHNVPLNVSQILTDPGSANMNYVFGTGQNLVYGARFGTPAMDLSWEVTREWGVGIDYTLLDQRLSGSFDYYNKTNTNTILLVKPVLNSVYEGDFYDHGAKVQNTGIEFSIAWSDQLANGLAYEIGANYSYNKNQVLEVKDTYNGATGGSLADGQISKRLQEGQPIYAWWMLEADGVWQSQEEINNADAVYGTAQPGQLKYKDQNGDGVIDDRDKVYFGSYLPSSNYAVHLNLEYKNFDFGIDGYGVAGNKVYNGLKYGRINGGENIAYETYRNRWTGEGSTNVHPGPNRAPIASSYYLESGAFFRINNITLGYTFQDLVAQGTSLRVYTTAQNPFMFTKYSGFTPEISSDGNPSLTPGIELSAYPTTRNFLFGINLQF
ncbi:SusC/RagA family TonB-linked outer membrane protein [Proteiniphilum acetatigenes]|uniref:SusC/RagA family TonB-linked outer membrane protein n=1 Tax=Proteiniphilum acetatigenes TaxID=294710 RepID=UPI0003804991|nr:TonB-dependent receptor [Proteiniphilum acetatigenes]